MVAIFISNLICQIRTFLTEYSTYWRQALHIHVIPRLYPFLSPPPPPDEFGAVVLALPLMTGFRRASV